MKTIGLGMLAGLAMLGALTAAQAAPDTAAAVRAYEITHQKAILTEFSDFLSLPNVATNVADVQRNAAFLTAMLKKRGFETRLMSAAPGTPPSIFGELNAPGARRTVIFYAHYDGQPVGQKGWRTPPFIPTMMSARLDKGGKPVDWRKTTGPMDPDWRLYARSTGDDKASIEALLIALDGLRAAGIKPSVNIKLLYEGEEEQGSPHLAAIVKQNRALLKGDVLIMGDGPMNQTGRQQVNFGNRGFVGGEFTVYGPMRPLHDGHYGNWAPSPAVMIARLVASLVDDDGHILIPHFYDDVAPPSAADLKAMAAMPDVETGLKTELGLGRSEGTERLANGYLRPALNIRAIHVGDDGAHAANAIATEAHASFDVRLAPGETPERVKRLIEGQLKREGWWVVDDTPDLATRLAHPKVLTLRWDAGDALATKSSLDAPASKAIAAAIGRASGEKVIELPIVGASSGMAEVVGPLDVPMVGVSIANYDDNQHAENENLRLGNLWDGAAVYGGLLADLNW